MVDNVDVTEGSGVTLATDDVAGIQFQRVKVVHGSDGVNDGDVSESNGLPTKQSQVQAARALIAVAFGSVGGSYASVGITGISTATEVLVQNDTDGLMYLSWDNSTNQHVLLPYSARTVAVVAGSSNLYMRYTSGNAPTAGNVYFETVE